MADRRLEPEQPLASYVLRVTGQPAVLRFELHDVRTGERHRFVRADSLVAFLRARGIEAGPFAIDPQPQDPKA